VLFQFASDCQCSSTLESVSPKELLSGDLDLGASEDLDVVLLGDTLIENCARGLALEFENDNVMTDRSGMAAVCHQLFRKDSGGRVNGMALGASGDRVGHLLYRLQQDPRILDNLNPKIWWIQIGANDLGEDHCSSESIAWATQPLVQAIKARHPDAKIVLNSIIPSQNWNGDNGKTRQHLNQANEYLRCFAKESNDFQFFDADHIFSIDGPDDSISLNGMRAWGEAIVKKVLEMTT
jgi:lysophospholipase L1-like esterase